MTIKATVKKGKKRPSPKVAVYEKELAEKDEHKYFTMLSEALLGVKKKEEDANEELR